MLNYGVFFFKSSALARIWDQIENVQLAQSNEIRLQVVKQIFQHFNEYKTMLVRMIYLKKIKWMQGYKVDSDEMKVNIHTLYGAKVWRNENLVCQIYSICTISIKKCYNSQLYYILNA